MSSHSEPQPVKTRDAQRSRERILDAAERLFAERGYDGASLIEIGAAAGLSRGTPSYFFGSKEGLYRAVLERVFRAREQSTRDAFASLHRWAASDAPRSELAAALSSAVGGYLRFLLGRPPFVRLLQREELAGGSRLHAVRRESRAMTDAFQAVHAVRRTRGLAAFKVDDAVLLTVSLTFSPLTQRSTFLVAIDRDFDDPAVVRRHCKLVVEQLLALIAAS